MAVVYVAQKSLAWELNLKSARKQLSWLQTRGVVVAGMTVVDMSLGVAEDIIELCEELKIVVEDVEDVETDEVSIQVKQLRSYP